MERRDDGTALEPEAAERVGELVEARRQLEVDVEPDVRRLVDEELERLLERRQLGRDGAQLGQRPLPHGPVGCAVADLVEVVGVREHERPAREVENVELDEVDAVRDGFAKRVERVLRREMRRAAMPDPEHGAVSAPEVDHAALRRAARSHHQATSARTTAWATVIAAASWETSSQNRSG